MVAASMQYGLVLEVPEAWMGALCPAPGAPLGAPNELNGFEGSVRRGSPAGC